MGMWLMWLRMGGCVCVSAATCTPTHTNYHTRAIQQHEQALKYGSNSYVNMLTHARTRAPEQHELRFM